jgi:hypothetical protein
MFIDLVVKDMPTKPDSPKTVRLGKEESDEG